ncbi:hypothetical protein N657DRAFT_645151, partial [Parathielavia appendiculata]
MAFPGFPRIRFSLLMTWTLSSVLGSALRSFPVAGSGTGIGCSNVRTEYRERGIASNISYRMYGSVQEKSCVVLGKVPILLPDV